MKPRTYGGAVKPIRRRRATGSTPVLAQLGHPGDQLLREVAPDVGVLDDRHEVVVDPLAHGVADHALLLGEHGVDVEVVDAGELVHMTVSFA